MARTIDTIKSELTTAFMSNETLAAKYNFTVGAEFLSVFSKVSLENILLYIIATSIWTMEKLFDTHKDDVQDIIDNQKPHTLRWYVTKAKAFMYGKSGISLIDGTDEYDTSSMSDDEIVEAQVVKFASCSEAAATLYMKVATTSGDEVIPLTDDQLAAFKAYMHEVKDAGVRMDITSTQGDFFKADLTVYYNPLLMTDIGESKSESGVYPVKDTVKAYIEGLPFNGEYRNNSLVDALQSTSGVEMVQLNSASYSYDGVNYYNIAAYCIPTAGYFKYDRAGEDTSLTITYLPYGIG